MFKFVKHFFIVFVITTIVPLLLMFLVINYQMKNIMRNNLDMSRVKLETSTMQYLKIQEGDILEKLTDIQGQELSLKQIKKVFKNEKIEPVYNIQYKVMSYYDVINDRVSGNPSLYSVCIFPAKDAKIKSIKITKKVNIKEILPNGPYNLKIYFGDRIDNKYYSEVVPNGIFAEKFKPPFAPKLSLPPPRINNQIVVKIERNSLKLKNNNGKVIAILFLVPPFPPFPFAPLNPIDNLFGIVILLAGITLSFVMGIYMQNNLVKPLLIISEALEKVKEGDLSVELDQKSKQKHILDIYNNFNNMVQGLKDREKLRKSFISNLTHDLKTPLLAQEKSLGFIAKKFGELNLKDEFDLAKSLENNNKHLLKMVKLIVESYSFDEEKLNLKPQKIKLITLINECSDELKLLISEKNIQFINEIPQNFPLIKGDLTSFKRIFLNLIYNAVENIPMGSFIKVSAGADNNIAKIYIEDNGNGISEEDLKYIFDRYFTGKSLERKLGAGLGLDVCKNLIKLHNGTIEAESKLNEYTKFIITLPLRAEKRKYD